MTDAHSQSAPEPSLDLDATVDRTSDRQRSVIAGRYIVLDVIAEGATGRVLQADDRVLRRRVAVKIPRTSDDQNAAESFLHEARSAAAIRHPGIVTVHDFGQEPDGSCYLVEDLIEGRSLATAIADEPFSIPDAVRLMVDVAEAVHAAHECGLVHRDLKPANILLDETGQAFVTDFGLALTDDRRDGDSSRVSGTPVYMSPEQTLGESDRLDARSDIWSLGVILYELLTGERPFPAAAIPVLFDQIQTQPVAPPSTVRRESISAELDAICLQCLEKDCSERFSNAHELAHSLKSQLVNYTEEGEPQATALDSPFHNRVVVASLAVAVITFASFCLLALLSKHETTDPRPHAEGALVHNSKPDDSSSDLSSSTNAVPEAKRLSTHKPRHPSNEETDTGQSLSQRSPNDTSTSGPR